MRLLTGFFVGPAPDGSFYLLSEIRFRRMGRLLVTALNLIPIGQFDGGHILYGLLGRRQHAFAWSRSSRSRAGILLADVVVFAVLGFVFRVEHPPTLNDSQPPDRPAVVMGIVSLIILVLSFTPMPIR